MIYGISDIKRMPRLGKIRLGEKKEKSKGVEYVEYPVQTDYFVVPDEIKNIVGEKPKKLDIMFPVNDIEAVFPQHYKLYGKTGLKCKGDGRTAVKKVNGELVETQCDGKCKGCKPIGVLNVILPRVKGFGVWQIWTSSYNSILNLNNSIRMIKAMTGGNIAFIPLKLRINEHMGTVETEKGSFQKKVYVLFLDIDTTMGQFYNKYSEEANMQRAIQESPGVAKLADAANKIKALNEAKKQSVDVNDEDFEEFNLITEEQKQEIIKLYKQIKLNAASYKKGCNDLIGKDNPETYQEAEIIVNKLKSMTS